jgi:hypothetical protein
MRRSVIVFALAAGCGTNLTPAPGPDAAGLACLPNLDQQITAAELPVALGVPATYYVSSGSRDVNLDPDDSGTWDFTRPTTDPTASFTAMPLTGKWYAGSFPGGQFAVATDATDTLEQVFAEDATGFWLLGVASTAPNQTLLPYDAPVALYRFPLTAGLAWTEVGVVSNGKLDGLPYVGRDTYVMSVDAPGRLVLPDVELEQAFLVHTTVTVAPSVGITVVHRQASFLFECLGEVARATARDGEPSDDFTTAAEVRRLTFGQE